MKHVEVEAVGNRAEVLKGIGRVTAVGKGVGPAVVFLPLTNLGDLNEYL
ncbi:MAG: hypothetical protein ACJAQ6_000495 [Arenicella sp.]|jgi:hypothetical protein